MTIDRRRLITTTGAVALASALGLGTTRQAAAAQKLTGVTYLPPSYADLAYGSQGLVDRINEKAGETVAVVGLGGIGLSAILGAVAAGASRIIAVDLQADKLEMAKTLGATDIFNAGEEGVADAVRAATGGGVDHAFEMAGSARALELAFAITRRGGATVTAGLTPPTATMALSPLKLVAEERTLKGSYVGSCIPSRDIPRYIALYRGGRLPVDRLLTSRGTLDDINEGFDALAAGRTVRHVVLL